MGTRIFAPIGRPGQTEQPGSSAVTDVGTSFFERTMGRCLPLDAIDPPAKRCFRKLRRPKLKTGHSVLAVNPVHEVIELRKRWETIAFGVRQKTRGNGIIRHWRDTEIYGGLRGRFGDRVWRARER